MCSYAISTVRMYSTYLGYYFNVEYMTWYVKLSQERYGPNSPILFHISSWVAIEVRILVSLHSGIQEILAELLNCLADHNLQCCRNSLCNRLLSTDKTYINSTAILGCRSSTTHWRKWEGGYVNISLQILNVLKQQGGHMKGNNSIFAWFKGEVTKLKI